MDLDIQLETASKVPPYEQIRSAIIVRISSGMLVPGDRLPAVRKLAAQLEVAAGTVARAYRELESAGVVVTAGRHGTIVASESGFAGPVMVAASDFVRAGQLAGMGADAILDCVREVLKQQNNRK